jgi:hypothetical protein
LEALIRHIRYMRQWASEENGNSVRLVLSPEEADQLLRLLEQGSPQPAPRPICGVADCTRESCNGSPQPSDAPAPKCDEHGLTLSCTFGCVAPAPACDECDHGVTFDPIASRGLSRAEIRKRWPRMSGVCPKGCGFYGAAYASYEHYIAGNW